MVNTICHEMKHAEQHEVVDAYRHADDRYKMLSTYDDARILYEEFLDYTNVNENREVYRNQVC